MDRLKYLTRKIERLPPNPGVYLFKGSRGEILYVGKAAHLRHRVRSYFQKPAGDPKTLSMLEQVADLDTLVTTNEKEAFLLEDNLIKEHHPRYNVKLRDDKNYPCLRLSLEEEFPVLSFVRRIRKDGALYFGPYPSARSLRETLKLIRRVFPIRTSLDTKFTQRMPSWEKIDPARYRETVDQVRMFLGGRNEDLIRSLKKKMEEEAKQLNFEAAARIRDQIEHVAKVMEKQKIVSPGFLDQDVAGFSRKEGGMAVYLLFIRGGRVLGGKGFFLPPSDLPEGEILGSFIRQYYRRGKFIPSQILVPAVPPDQSFIETWLGEERKERVRILVPRRGEKRDLLNLAGENVEKFLISRSGGNSQDLLEMLQEKLHLGKLPQRIEAFDISNFQGKHAVGSMVVFEEGKPLRERYRHFRIKTVPAADDYGMMEEVLLRRYQRALAEKDLPDLVLLDGGRGQLNVALQVFKKLGIQGVDMVSLAKERTLAGPPGPGRTEEKIFHPGYKDFFTLKRHSSILNLLDHIRDEAHRFAITYHKKVRSKGTMKSILGEIPGIGGTRQKALLEFFGSVDKIKGASPGELARVPKMSGRAARGVYDFFHQPQGGDLAPDPSDST
ncbi:MAG: excinuclease ABC subunit UvrC [Planctomycetaceae bacterium]